MSAFEDKLGQDALREVLEAIYEQDFIDCSFGFRPGRSAHDALRALDRATHRGEVSWILEADIASFFDSVDRKTLLEMLRARVADGSLLRLIGKCLHVGVLDGAAYTEPDLGTAQGSVIAPPCGVATSAPAAVVAIAAETSLARRHEPAVTARDSSNTTAGGGRAAVVLYAHLADQERASQVTSRLASVGKTGAVK